MNNSEAAQHSVDFDSETTQKRVQVVEQQVARFQHLLDGESALMKARNVDDLPAMVARKNDVINTLMAHESFLIELLTRYPEEPAVLKLKEQLEACRALNRENQVFAAVELRATHRGLELLRSVQRMDDLPLYGAAGKISVSREKRDLGQA